MLMYVGKDPETRMDVTYLTGTFGLHFLQFPDKLQYKYSC